MRIVVLSKSSPEAARRKLEQVTSLLADMMLQMVEPWPVVAADSPVCTPYSQNSRKPSGCNNFLGKGAG